MFVAVVWLPHKEADQWLYLRFQRPRALDSRITVVDVRLPTSTNDPVALRRLTADFLNGLIRSGQRPAAVVLDIVFKPCEKPCDGPRAAARQALVDAIAAARRARVPVYAAENRTQVHDSKGAEISGRLDDRDSEIYGPHGLAGAAGHTEVRIAEGTGLMSFRPCYRLVEMPADEGIPHREDIWALALRAQPNFDAGACDADPVTLYVGPQASAPGAPYSTIPRRASQTIAPRNPFPKTALSDYVVVGRSQTDTLAKEDPELEANAAGAAWVELHGSGSLDIAGSELVAWAISGALDRQAATSEATQPLGRSLYFVTPAFSALTVLTFAGCFLSIRRLRLRKARGAAPWVAAALALGIGLGFFVATEQLLDVVFHRVQPQVSLVVLGIGLSALLSGVRGNQLLAGLKPEEDESYDYDVFVSYSHADEAWVRAHVLTALERVRLPAGKPLSVFFDKKALYAGDNWRKKLTLAILNSRFVIAVYSTNYFRREGKGYCIFELECAYQKWIELGKASQFLTPIALDHFDLPPEYGQLQYVSVLDRPDIVEQLAAEIVERLGVATPSL